MASEGTVIKGAFLTPIAIDTQSRTTFATTLSSPGAVVNATSMTLDSVAEIYPNDILIVDAYPTAEPNPIQVLTVVGNVITFTPPLQIAHSAGAIISKTYAQQIVGIGDSQKATYSASAVSVAAQAGDVFSLSGSDTNIVKIRYIYVAGQNTSNQLTDLLIIKRFTNDTNGDSVALESITSDSVDADATALATLYTVSPTYGTEAGIIDASKLFTPLNSLPSEYKRCWATDASKPPVLNNSDECICIFVGQNVSSLTISISWTEE
jgi:hypothetical protein